MQTLKLLLLIVVVSFLGCKKDNGSKLPVIKGIQKRNFQAHPAGVEGAPNIKTKSDGTGLDFMEMVAYPNPANSQLRLSIYSNAGQARIWMVRGRYKEGKFGPNDILGIGLYIPIDMTVDLGGQVNSIDIDLKDVRNGYYRLYVEFGSYTLWDNVKVDKP